MGRRKFASIRHVYCDCAIRVTPKDGGDDTRDYDIVGHRAVLAQAAYFDRLFTHVKAEQIIDQGDADDAAQRPSRLVYRVGIPFAADSVSFLVDVLYGAAETDNVGNVCADPVDVVMAATYLGMNQTDIVDLIDASLSTLLTALDAKEDRAVEQLGAFVLHIVHSDMEPNLKTALLARTFGLLSEADRLSVPADMVPVHYYRPEPSVATSARDDMRGRRWREISLPWDACHDGDDDDSKCGREIVWQGIRFGVHITGSSYDSTGDVHEMEVYISARPDGEVLGGWTPYSPMPAGAIESTPRAAVVTVTAFHPTRGTKIARGWAKPVGEEKPDAHNLGRQKANYAATGHRLDKHMALVPTVPSFFSRGEAHATRARHVVRVDAEWSDLLACMVQIEVQELA